jgi:mannose-6-phosphate isomerase
VDAPLLLAPDNFTPLARTPWAGRWMREVLKRDVAGAADAVGESWEVSFGPELPSRIEGSDRTLDAVARTHGAAFLGREAARGSSALLVKLLDAAEPLSVQIHPSDDDPALASDESGKPESWYVVRAEPGAVIFLGLAEHARRETMARLLAEGGDVSSQLLRVPVSAGDFFVVPAGTPHAIGAGLVLVEPQRVLPGRRGLTYRYWDWNRRYDADGHPSPRGAPRSLHVERALAVTRWDAARGEAFLREARLRVGVDLERAPSIAWVAGPRGGLASDALEVGVLAGTGSLDVPRTDAVEAWTVLDGELVLRGAFGALSLARGRSAVVPASVGAMIAECRAARAVISSAL